MIVADTDVVSEFMRDAPDPVVLAWAGTVKPPELAICVVTVEEIERGIGRLPASERRGQLEERWRRQLAAFQEAILVYDVDAAQATARVVSADANAASVARIAQNVTNKRRQRHGRRAAVVDHRPSSRHRRLCRTRNAAILSAAEIRASASQLVCARR